MIGKNNQSIEEREVAFQIGVTMIGQPIYHIHKVVQTDNQYGKHKGLVIQSQTIG
jgi:hypothetical protein